MPAEQLSLVDRAAYSATFDPNFSSLRRTELGFDGWVDYAPRWLDGHSILFDRLRREGTWSSGRRLMYERFVDVPRLLGDLPQGSRPAVVDAMAEVLSARYGARFDAVSLALYRDGADSVAYHQDKGLQDMPESTLAIVSVGEPRSFRLRPLGGGASLAFRCGWGDLLVMGGTCQRHWEHGVPKARQAGPRMSIMFRCSTDWPSRVPPGSLRVDSAV